MFEGKLSRTTLLSTVWVMESVNVEPIGRNLFPQNSFFKAEDPKEKRYHDSPLKPAIQYQ
jgi:hypothetical protein